MQPPPGHLPPAYWSADASYNGQAGFGEWNGNSRGGAHAAHFQPHRGGRGGRRGRGRGRGGQQQSIPPYQQQEGQADGRRGGRRRGGRGGRSGGAEGGMNAVWYKPSFLDDPWAALEGRPPGPFHFPTAAMQAGAEHSSSRQLGEAQAVDLQRGEASAATAGPASTSSASPTASNRASLVLPPPQHF